MPVSAWAQRNEWRENPVLPLLPPPLISRCKNKRDWMTHDSLGFFFTHSTIHSILSTTYTIIECCFLRHIKYNLCIYKSMRSLASYSFVFIYSRVYESRDSVKETSKLRIFASFVCLCERVQYKDIYSTWQTYHLFNWMMEIGCPHLDWGQWL